MCALCGSLGGGHWAEAAGRDARRTRNTLLGRILPAFGLQLEQWGGVVYPVRGADGTLAVANDLGSLWAESERLRGAALDPLDPVLLGELER